ncbi:MAG: hypothetical protein CL946_03550, partial [Ectothiorhodospiraceae bacterium]|nr:hypothetical protein [Ectothiorhodospiraceae bacterium]
MHHHTIRFLAILWIGLLAFPQDALTQYYEPKCEMGSMPLGLMKVDTSQIQDAIPPITGDTRSVHALVVLVRFPDDTETNTNWPAPVDEMPDYMESIVHASPTDPNFGQTENISDYFYENSYHKLKITGEVVYVTLPQNEADYLNTLGKLNIWSVLPDAFTAVDTKLQNESRDFSEFDHWEHDGNDWIYHPNSANSDGNIDLTVFIMRNKHHPWNFW